MDERVNKWRLCLACDHDARAAVRFEIAHHRLEPLLVPVLTWRSGNSKPRSDRRRELADLGGRHGSAMVGFEPGDCRRAFKNVKTVHTGPGRIRRSEDAARRKIANVAQMSRPPIEKVGIERDDHAVAVKVIDTIDVTSEGHSRSGTGVVVVNRLILVPLCLWKSAQDRIDQCALRGGRNSARQESQSCAVPGPQFLEPRRQRRYESAECGDRSAVGHGLGAVGIIQIQNRGLSEDIRCAETCAVPRITFNLDRPAFMALHDQTDAVTCEGHRRREMQRSSRQHIFRRLDVRNDLFGERCGRRTAFDTRQRQRRRH